MDSVNEYNTKKEYINEMRVNTANFFQAHNRFEYDKISLMEISYTHHMIQGRISDNNIYSTHSILIREFIKKYESIDNEIKTPPYFPTTRMEYWVCNETAINLMKALDEYFNCSSFNEPSHSPPNEQTIERAAIIKKILNQPILDVIKDLNPSYEGDVHNKTSAPHKLIIRIITIMFKLKIPKTKITWTSIHPFLEKYIYQNYSLKTLTGLEELEEDKLKVEGVTFFKRNIRNKISYYKKDILKLT
jgi:hypothetical protein